MFVSKPKNVCCLFSSVETATQTKHNKQWNRKKKFEHPKISCHHLIMRIVTEYYNHSKFAHQQNTIL